MAARAPEGWAEEAELGPGEDSLRRFLRLQVRVFLHLQVPATLAQTKTSCRVLGWKRTCNRLLRLKVRFQAKKKKLVTGVEEFVR